jgi:hypothetical protein
MPVVPAPLENAVCNYIGPKPAFDRGRPKIQKIGKFGKFTPHTKHSAFSATATSQAATPGGFAPQTWHRP